MKGFLKSQGSGSQGLRTRMLGGKVLIWKGVLGSLWCGFRHSGRQSRAAVLGSRGAVFGTELEVVLQNPTSGGLGFQGSRQVLRF